MQYSPPILSVSFHWKKRLWFTRCNCLYTLL